MTMNEELTMTDVTYKQLFFNAGLGSNNRRQLITLKLRAELQINFGKVT